MKILYCFILIFLPTSLFSQVGINTTTPLDTLHVNGTVRIVNTNSSIATKLMGANDNGTINEVIVGQNLALTTGTLNAFGSASYGIISLSVTDGPVNEEFNDYDLGVNGVNQDKTVFRLTGRTNSYRFTGIEGGTDGRHIVLLNIPAVNFRLENESTSSLAQNRIITLSGGFESTSGQGSAELVYDGALQRWFLINLRN
ncbi:hypothetical protein [Flavivirga rizhaonensis]|uniref:DUF4402 domain-containing protein n=1 Tax=Flavivirga rizhaonensis TaxID=2559571 RepID=A0A4S1DXQ9_9FLAO|nr:hypothetical protein [Flavivirga rizhaonensis]TGV02743.1 hypothetical protein EM932_09950 [Flavivirga rizhaonensis]